MDLHEGRFTPREGLLRTEVDGQAVLLDPASGGYFGLEGAGTPAWRRLTEGPASFADILEAVLKEYEVDRATAEADLEAFVADLLREGLVVRA